MRYRIKNFDNGITYYVNWRELNEAELALEKEVRLGMLSCKVDLTEVALDAMARNLYMRPSVGEA